mgnify:CR=1 FL=1
MVADERRGKLLELVRQQGFATLPDLAAQLLGRFDGRFAVKAVADTLGVVSSNPMGGAIVHLEEFLFPHSCRAPADYFDYAIARYVAFLGDFLLKARSHSVAFAGLAQPEQLAAVAHVNW